MNVRILFLRGWEVNAELRRPATEFRQTVPSEPLVLLDARKYPSRIALKPTSSAGVLTHPRQNLSSRDRLGPLALISQWENNTGTVHR